LLHQKNKDLAAAKGEVRVAAAHGGKVRVKMKSELSVDELRIGMYVCDLDRPWRETPFLFQGFEIQSQVDIDMLRQYCQRVTILDRQAMSATSPRPARAVRPPVVDAGTSRFRSMRVEQEVYKINNHPSARPVYQDVTTLKQEVDKVRNTFIEARLLIQEFLHDAKLGRSLDVRSAQAVVRSMTESVLRNPDALMCFAQLKHKDEYTAQHGLRVCVLALILGRHLGMPREQLEVLGLGSLLHDVGMVRVPDSILAKSGTLTPEEFSIMQQHVNWGVEILSGGYNVPREALDIVRDHHERYDGSGYLHGLRGDQIGNFATICAITDHYDAVTSDRSYKAAVSAHQVLLNMYEWRNVLFRAEMVEKFIQCLGVYPIGSIVELNSGEIGVVAAINRLQRLKPHVMLVYRADQRPYEEMPVANLANYSLPDGRPGEIERVLDSGVAGIDPAYYLRMAVSM